MTTRRVFLKTAAVAAAAIPALDIIPASAQGANERIGVGFIGVGGRSGAHQGIIKNFQKEGIAEPVAVCDVYRPRLVKASENLGGCKMYDEHENLLADPNVDVVCIAA
nr:Gfo/Idh/MocA family oxidoreductase [Thermoguttaceae bacterium]